MLIQQWPIRLSASAVRTFADCEYRYFRTYVSPIKAAQALRSAPLVTGEVVHAVIADFFRHGGWSRVGRDDLDVLLSVHWRAAHYADDEIAQANLTRARELLTTFHARPFPAVATRELGVERWLQWRRPHKGIIATGRVDRACWVPGDSLLLIDYKTGRFRPSDTSLARDPQALFYRSLGADVFQELQPRKVIVTFFYLDPGLPLDVEFDQTTFDAGWRHLVSIGDAIRAAKTLVSQGASLLDAFPPNPGARCASCPLRAHCQAVLQPGNQGALRPVGHTA